MESQEAACIAKAQELGYTSWRVVREVYSGAKLYERDLLNHIREVDLKSGQFQALITHDQDCLAREPVHFALIAYDCERYGVQLITVIEPLDNSPTGQLISYVRGFAAKLEREKIRERTLRGKRQHALNGRIHNFGPELYGYRRDRTTGKRVIHDPEAAVVRDIYIMIVGERIGATATATRLNKRGIPTASAGKYTLSDPNRQPIWRTNQELKIVRNLAYKGETYAWTCCGSAPESEWIRLPDDVTPPIVSPELWQQAQDALSEIHSEATRNEKHPALLRGFVYCAVCGRRMYNSSENTHGRAYIQIYNCSSQQRIGRSCGVTRVLASELEAWLWEKISNTLRKPEVIAAELERRRTERPDETLASDLETAKREYTKRDRKQAQLMERWTTSEDDSFPWDVVEREVARLEREKENHLKTIAEIEGRIAEQEQSVVQLERLVEYCARVSQNLDRFGFEDKRMAYQALQVRITANGGDWTVKGSIPIPVESDALDADDQMTSDECLVFQTRSAGTVYDRRARARDFLRDD